MADLDVMQRRAERCVTHHHGCDCREYERALLVEVERAARAHVDTFRGPERTPEQEEAMVDVGFTVLVALGQALAALDAWRAEVGGHGD